VSANQFVGSYMQALRPFMFLASCINIPGIMAAFGLASVPYFLSAI
jgi:hypothetical protein